MLLTTKEGVHTQSDLSREGREQYFEAIAFIEHLAFRKLGAVKINYLALMMVDPLLHFHVFPRFDTDVRKSGVVLKDKYYPGLIDILSDSIYDVESIYKIYQTI